MESQIKVTDLELTILQRIWVAHDDATVQAIVDSWEDTPKPGYTTILKTLQKMEKKGIVGHRQDGRKYYYHSQVSRDQVTRTRLGTLIERVFSGDKISFAEHFINSSQFSPDELADLKKLIADKEREEKR